MVETGVAMIVMDGPSTTATHARRLFDTAPHGSPCHRSYTQVTVAYPRAEEAAKANFI